MLRRRRVPFQRDSQSFGCTAEGVFRQAKSPKKSRNSPLRYQGNCYDIQLLALSGETLRSHLVHPSGYPTGEISPRSTDLVEDKNLGVRDLGC